MKKIILVGLLVILSLIAISQPKFIKIKNKNEGTNVSEIYYVLKSDRSIKNGDYIYSFKKKPQVKGSYINNQKDGKWIYTPSSSLKIFGNYKNDLMVGKWIYQENDDTISINYYSLGKLNGLQIGFHDNGIIASQINYINGIKDGEEKFFLKMEA